MRLRSLAPVAIAPLFLFTAALTGCEQDPAPSEVVDAPVGTHEEIFGGAADTSNQYRAVVALAGGGYACSGTIIATNGSSAYVLTAAHCTGMTTVMITSDSSKCPNGAACEDTYVVQQDVVHPMYHKGNGTSQDPDYNDFRILRIDGATGVPVIPAATNPDGLNANGGDAVTEVGFGITENNNQNTLRRFVNVVTDQATSLFVVVDQTNGKGTCSGDSGGPTIFNGKVVGVTSFGDEFCTSFGVSGRVQSAQSWIASVTGGTVVETCDSCFDTEVNQPAGDCYANVDACFADTACEALITCLNGCSTATCQQNCANASTSAAIAKYNAIFDCACTSCSTLCAAECADPGTGSTTGSGGITTGNGSGGGTGAGGAAAAAGSGGSSNAAGDGNADGGETGGIGNQCNCATPGAPAGSPFAALGLAGAAIALGAMRRRRRS